MKDASLPKFRLSLLARFELSGPDGPVDLPGKKLAGLLAYLACTAPVRQSREKLATLLWGSHFEIQAQQNLRQALSRLRRVLGHDAVISDDDAVWLTPGAIDCDAVRLEALISEGSQTSLAAATDLYQGALLADLNVGEESWADWLGAERLRLEALALGAMIGHAEHALQAGNAEFALKAAYRVIAVNALREDAHRLIVQALSAAGRTPEALKHYQNLVALLKRELNTEPDALTKSLVAELGTTQPPRRATAVAGPADAPDHAALPAPTNRSTNLERRQLTIMVCTIVGSAQLAARRDPEDMHDLIESFHKTITDAVSPFDGYVALYLGDGTHVYFGYPEAREHDAEQAVRAGLAILDAVGALKDTSGAPLQASVGIATGLVVVGEPPATGDAQQRVAIGEAPSVAAQLQAVASPGEIVIAASTWRLAGRMFDCRALGTIEVKGLPQPVEAWQVRGETAGVSRFEARRTSALSPLVGRKEEIDLLLRRWDQARRGEGRVVLLEGEPGIGKSRIAESVLAMLKGKPHACLRYFCSPHHTHSPLYPFIAQIEQSFEPGSSAKAKLEKLQALFKGTAGNMQQDVALIAELLAVPADERTPALAITPQHKREMILTALIDRLDGAAAQGPVLIVFEDVHWIDPTSLDLLNRFIARIVNLPVLLVITFRSEFQPVWVGEPHVSMLPLSRLGRPDSAAIIGDVAKGKALPDAVLEQVLARTDGVPLFIEELTSTLLESELLREMTDSYVLDGPLPPLAIPTTLQASLVARLDRLGAARDLALIGAAIGREFSHELIAAVAALPPVDLDAALERLTASGLLSRRGTPPAATYAFKHVLVQEAAYATLLKSRRQQLHARIAKVLVERFPAMVESLPELVAHHFTEAALASEAIDYWIRAGRLGYARSAHRESARLFERGLEVLAMLPESRSSLEQGFDLRLELRLALNGLGEFRRALERLREAELLAERLNDDHRRGRACAAMTNPHVLLGELDEALAYGTRALEIAERLGDLRLRVPATTFLEQAYYLRGEYERVVTLATSNLAALPPNHVSDHFGLAAPPSVYDRGWLMMSLAHLGRFAEAAEPEAEAIRLAAPSQNGFTIGWAHLMAGSVHLRRGDWAQARHHFERAVAVCRAKRSFLLLPLAVAPSAWVLAHLGETNEALNRLREGEQLVERHATTGSVGVLGSLYAPLGRAALLLGRLDDAWRLGARAVEACPRQPGSAAEALHLLGDVAAHPDRLDAERCETQYRQTLALAESLGMRPLVAHCHFGLGQIYLRTSRRDQARDHLTTATTMYREMDMPFWLAQAEAEMSRPQSTSLRLHPPNRSPAVRKAAEPPLPQPDPVPLPDKPSIAVLAFQNMSGDPEQEYFSDGISEDIITDLSKISGLMVIARNSSFTYKNKAVDVRAIGRNIGVRYVLEGSVRRAGNRIRITAQLIDASNGMHLWADRFDRELSDLFAVQDDVTSKIVNALKITLSPAEKTRLAAGGTNDIEAYDFLLRGREFLLGAAKTRETFKRATDFFARALELYPDYSQAYAGLGWAHLFDYQNGWTGDSGNAMQLAKQNVARALETDPNEPLAHVTAAILATFEADFERSKAEADIALVLNPNCTEAYACLGHICTLSGRPLDAIPMLEQAMVLDPLYIQQYLHLLGVANVVAGRYETAAVVLRQRILLVPGTDFSRALLAAALGHLGEIDEARRIWRELKQINPRYSFSEHFGRQPFKNNDDVRRIAEGLAKAGLSS